MTFLPIVARELRVASRKRGTFWGRTGAALAVVVVGTWSFLLSGQAAPSDVALTLFGIMTGSAALYCLFSGLWSTADCLSQEKREGTLGLLFLTDLRGYDVVLGKLAATSLNAFYGVLAMVPMLAVPMLLGGLTPGEFGRMALVILDTLFFSLTLGLCVSAASRSARKAVLATFLLILVFAIILPICSAWMTFLGKSPRLTEPLLLPSPGFAFGAAFDSSYKIMSKAFWWSIGVIQGLGWVFLVSASVVAPRAWQDRPGAGLGLRWRERWHEWNFGEPGERTAFRNRLLDENAYFWLAARARLRPVFVWGVLGLVACVWAWGLAKYHTQWLLPAMYLLTAGFLNALLKCWAAAEAGRQLAEDRQAGTLELILSTPLTVRDILHGQFLALQRQFLGPVAVTLLAFLVFLAATLSDTLDDGQRALTISALSLGHGQPGGGRGGHALDGVMARLDGPQPPAGGHGEHGPCPGAALARNGRRPPAHRLLRRLRLRAPAHGPGGPLAGPGNHHRHRFRRARPLQAIRRVPPGRRRTICCAPGILEQNVWEMS